MTLWSRARSGHQDTRSQFLTGFSTTERFRANWRSCMTRASGLWCSPTRGTSGVPWMESVPWPSRAMLMTSQRSWGCHCLSWHQRSVTSTASQILVCGNTLQ
ncbi:unnamed protein product, partial [Symbiodinium pilosum]